MKTKTPKPLSPKRVLRKLLRDATVKDAQSRADLSRITHYIYEVKDSARSCPFVLIPSGAITPTNGKLILAVRPA